MIDPPELTPELLEKFERQSEDWRRTMAPLIKDLEKAVKPGGWIVLSVPSGPVEHEMWVTSPFRLREHISEFSLLDLEDMLGHKESFHFHSASCDKSEILGILI